MRGPVVLGRTKCGQRSWPQDSKGARQGGSEACNPPPGFESVQHEVEIAAVPAALATPRTPQTSLFSDSSSLARSRGWPSSLLPKGSLAGSFLPQPDFAARDSQTCFLRGRFPNLTVSHPATTPLASRGLRLPVRPSVLPVFWGFDEIDTAIETEQPSKIRDFAHLRVVPHWLLSGSRRPGPTDARAG